MQRLRPIASATALLVPVLAPGGLGAGGIDQSGQPVTAVFEQGRHLELAWGRWLPELSGETPGGGQTGNVYGPLTGGIAALHVDLAPRWSAAVILDRPYGIVVDYSRDFAESGFPYAGTKAEPRSLGVTGLVRFKAGRGFSLHGGLRATRFGTDATLGGPGFGPLDGYRWQTDDDWGLGYVVGAAFEIPDVALRVALTYGSETDVDLHGTETLAGTATATTTRLTLPRSVNLDLQSGIAPGTLLYASVRWADWGGWEAAPPVFTAASGKPIVTFAEDTFSYRLGVGRQLTDRWAATVEVSHESGTGESQTALTPYEGFTAFGVGAAYALPSGLTLAGFATWYALGDATVATPTGATEFRGNNALGLGLKLNYRF